MREAEKYERRQNEIENEREQKKEERESERREKEKRGIYTWIKFWHQRRTVYLSICVIPALIILVHSFIKIIKK